MERSRSSVFSERRKRLHIETAEELVRLKIVIPNSSKLEKLAGYANLESLREIEDPQVIVEHFLELEEFLLALTKVVKSYEEVVEELPDKPDGEQHRSGAVSEVE